MTGFKQLVRLVKLFTDAPANPYEPKDISITFGEARIRYTAVPSDIAADGYIDRSTYTKLMMDAATLAAGSLDNTYFVKADSFNVYGVTEVDPGIITAVARLIHTEDGTFTVEARLYSVDNAPIASAHGTFSASGIPLDETTYEGHELSEDMLDELEDLEDAEDDDDRRPTPMAYGTIWNSPVGFIHMN